MKKKPNILFLMSDEHRFDVSGFMGNSIIHTPCLDQLAQDSVVFDNAYTPYPVCIPARQCMAAGQYAKHCRVEHFGEDLKPEYLTLPRVFGHHGYKTVAAGKLHHVGMDQMQGWQIRLAGDTQVSNHYYGSPKSDRIRNKWDEKKEILRATPGESAYARRDKLTIQATKDFIYEQFVDPLYDRANSDEPLFLYVGLLNPHYPYIAEEKKFNYYLNRVRPYENNKPFDHSFLGRSANCGALEIGKDISERDVKRAMAAYYANIETIDEQFQEVITCLEEAGQNMDDWIIIYTTDHGEMLGEHAIWEKQRFFEGSARVPLLVRYPKEYQSCRCQRNVNLIDLFPTLCDLCGIEKPDDLDGRSLVSCLDGKGEGANITYSQYSHDCLMIKNDDLKYQWYGYEGSEILFDLKKDPMECKDVSHDPAYENQMKQFRIWKEHYWKEEWKTLYSNND